MTTGTVPEADTEPPEDVDDGATGQRAVTLLVAIDNELVRRGIVSMLRSLAQVGEVWACGGADEAVGLLAERGPDIVLCHGGGDSLAPLVDAAGARGSRVLLMLEDLDLETVDESVMLTADGFLMQDDATVDALQHAVEQLRTGRLTLPTGLARALLARGRSGASGRWSAAVSLTTRERQVLAHLAEGLSNKPIARLLAISEHGVKRHVTNLLAKLNAPNRTLAVAVALRDGLISPPDGDGGVSARPAGQHPAPLPVRRPVSAPVPGARHPEAANTTNTANTANPDDRVLSANTGRS